MFDSTKKTLKDLLKLVDSGELQLPDFQRDYVWPESAITSLLASVAKGYPVGALLTLERGGSMDFKARGLEGTDIESKVPDELLLDGQQRMTSLFQSLYSKKPALVNSAKGERVKRYFYLNINKALSPQADFEEAIEIFPDTRIRMKNFAKEVDCDLSTKEKEYEQNMFPLNIAFDERDWLYGWRDHWRERNPKIFDMERSLHQGILERIQRYEMPLIKLDKNNSREAVCTIFEKVNVGGVKLDAFELVTAIYAGSKKGFDLRADWLGTKDSHGRLGRMRSGTYRDGVFSKLASTDFLQSCTLLHTRDIQIARKAAKVNDQLLPQITCKREAMLALPLDAYETYAPKVEVGFIEASKFLAEQKIVYLKELPYPPQVVALASVFAVLGEKGNNAGVRAKLAQWYWTGVFGEYYGGSTETKISRDFWQILDWLQDETKPPQVLNEAEFVAKRLHGLRRRVAAAYKGFHALMMREGCQDFVSGKSFDLLALWQEPVDVHHIFPKSWCASNGKKVDDFDAIINKTPLSAATNRYIVRGDAPSVYLRRIEVEHNLAADQLDAVLRTHLIDPALMRADDFEGFFADRKERLAKLAITAMGRTKIEEGLTEGQTVDPPEDDDETEAGLTMAAAE